VLDSCDGARCVSAYRLSVKDLPMRWIFVALCFWALVPQAFAQVNDQQVPVSNKKQAALQETLSNLINAEAELRAEIADLRRQLRSDQTEIDTQDIEAQLADKREELRVTSARLEELATGFAPEDINSGNPADFNLESELQQLVEPFVSMMKSATEDARQIERLRRLEQTTEMRIAMAKRAILEIETLIAQTEGQAPRQRLELLLKSWQERLEEARDLSVATQRQLETTLKNQDQASASGHAIGEFVRTRGRNLFLGLFAFVAVFIGLRFSSSGLNTAIKKVRKREKPRNFTQRLFRLIFNVGSVFLAFAAMLLVFDFFNDWLLFGLGLVAFAAGLWYVLKALPSLMQQAALLLNLGAVQEGERVVFKGVPFLVQKLDFYSHLVNPKMRGGHFVIPISELRGYHSRPVAEDEIWFPCSEGDVVILSDERWGRVTFISPECVVMEDDGGSANTFEIADFLALSPRNMSDGYRTESEFGVDYRHQAIATTDIPRIMAAEVRKDLEARFGKEKVRNVAVEFMTAGDSALIYEVEADMTSEAAWEWEEVKFALAKFATDSCTRNGWNIPFPQLTISRSPS